MKLNQHSKHILTVTNFWSADKCDEFISSSESIGYEPALVQTENGPKRVEGVRNNQRILFTDELLADEIWEALIEFAPAKIGKQLSK